MDLSEGLSLSAGLTAAYAMQKADEDGWNDATASAGASYALTENWALNGSVTVIEQLDDAVLTDAEYDADVVGMIGLSCDF